MACYFLEAVGLNVRKIGVGWSGIGRLRSQMAMSPVPLKLAAEDKRGDGLTEAQLHWRFRATLSHAEWFRTTAELLALIEATAATGSIPGAWYMPDRYYRDAYSVPSIARADSPACICKRFGLSSQDFYRFLGGVKSEFGARLTIKHVPRLYEAMRSSGIELTPSDLLDQELVRLAAKKAA